MIILGIECAQGACAWCDERDCQCSCHEDELPIINYDDEY